MGYGFRMGRLLADVVGGQRPEALDLFAASRVDDATGTTGAEAESTAGQ
jgi:hypothetical protein